MLVGPLDNRQNILIAGGTGTGKTTLLNALASLIPKEDRLLIIEDTAEIQIKQPHIIRFEARNAIHNTSDANKSIPAVTIRDLLKAALRHRPDRIILGEIRGTEAADLLQALNTGHGGTFSTIHANSAYLALERLKDLVIQSAENIKAESAFRSIAHAIHLVLFIERHQGRRYVKEALRIKGFNTAEGEIITEIIYAHSNPQVSTTSLYALNRATAAPHSTTAATATLEVTHKLNHKPTSEDLATHLGMTLTEFFAFRDRAVPLVFHTTGSMPEVSNTPATYVAIPTSSAPDPEDLALKDELRQRLAHALELLPPKQRQLILLHIGFDLPVKQIIKRLHTDPRTVKESIQSAMIRLRAQLGQSKPATTRILTPEPIPEVEEQQSFQPQNQHCHAFA